MVRSVSSLIESDLNLRIVLRVLMAFNTSFIIGCPQGIPLSLAVQAKPLESVFGSSGGFVLAPYPPVITRCLNGLEEIGEVYFTCTWLVPPRVVCNLYM